ncbi:protein kinase domain-containing protein [Streptomyces mirabilis]|uniref:protein kinase domain-containing protein n=1 Tax=Streptomyces mirabilis TaxID=68239 RepID=UPI003F74D84C
MTGPSLQEAVAEHGPLPPTTVPALAAGLAEALMSIHAVNLVHRDLKPSNALLADDGPRVIDFGIARSVEADSMTRTRTRTRTGIMVSAPGFMSPEQVAGGEITPASDVFSGAVPGAAQLTSQPEPRRRISRRPNLAQCASRAGRAAPARSSDPWAVRSRS